MPVKQDFPSGGLNQAHHRTQDSGLAGAVRAEQTDDLVTAYRKRHVPDRDEPVVVRLAELADHQRPVGHLFVHSGHRAAAPPAGHHRDRGDREDQHQNQHAQHTRPEPPGAGPDSGHLRDGQLPGAKADPIW